MFGTNLGLVATSSLCMVYLHLSSIVHQNFFRPNNVLSVKDIDALFTYALPKCYVEF